MMTEESAGRGFSIWVFRCTFVLMLVAICWQTAFHLQGYLRGEYTYWYGCINEMLVNWQGGFVRRGLFGELLFQARSLVPFPVDDAIVAIYFLGVAFLTFCLVRMFVRNGWSLFILPFPMCLYTFLADPYFMISRRDAWSLLLAFASFMFYRDFVKSGKTAKLLLCHCSVLAAMLLHEAFFFFAFLIIFLHDFWRSYKANSHILPVLCTEVVRWSPVLACLCVVVLCHGGEHVVRDIWASWSPYLSDSVTAELVDQSYMSRTMDWSLWYCITEIVLPNSWGASFVWKIPALPFNLYLFASLYYLATRVNTIQLGWYRLHQVDTLQLSNIVIVQFCCVLPLLLLVFCDWGRALPYWVMSSFMFFHFFRDTADAPRLLTRFSAKCQGWIDKVPFLNSSWGYYVILLTLPLGFMHATISGMFPIIPLQLKHFLIDGHWMAL